MNIMNIRAEKDYYRLFIVLTAFLTGWIAQYWNATDVPEYVIPTILLGFILVSVKIEVKRVEE